MLLIPRRNVTSGRKPSAPFRVRPRVTPRVHASDTLRGGKADGLDWKLEMHVRQLGLQQG